MALVPIVMPQLGESVAEATLSRWLVKEGDEVVRDQTIAEASTDKADTELPSPLSGRITRLLVAEGETVPVLTPIAEVETEARAVPGPAQGRPAPAAGAGPERAEPKPPAGGKAPPAEKRPAEAPAVPEPQPAREPEPLRAARGAGSEVETISAAPPAGGPAPRPAAGKPEPGPAAGKPEPGPAASEPRAEEEPPRRAEPGRIRSSPLVRRIAREKGIDLSRVEGTGSNGRVTKSDLLGWIGRQPEAREPPPIRAAQPRPERPAAREARAPAGEPQAPRPKAPEWRPPPFQSMPGDEVVPFTRRRRLIAGHMAYSKRTAPHVACMAEVDLHAVARQRKAAGKGAPSVLAYLAVAAVRAVRDYPIVNATVLEDSYVVRKVVNLGIAVDTPEGLVVPVIREADSLSITGMARAIAELAEKARAGTLSADELAYGTLSLSNPGPRGNVWGTPVISQPQVAILRMGEIVKRAVVVDHDGEDAIVVRPIMDLVLSYDHRIIDGVAGNGYLRRVKELLEAGLREDGAAG